MPPRVAERDKATRLHLVQEAAAQAIAIGGLAGGRPAEFRGLQIFRPFSATDIASAEYAWRQRLPRAWERAGYFHARVAGRGHQKFRLFQVTTLGRQALPRIAGDPIIASFYVSIVAGATSSDPIDFQPPQLRAAKEAEAEAGGDVESAYDEFNKRRAARAEAEEVEEEQQPVEDDEISAAPATDPAAANLAVFFDRSIAVLERMDDKLGVFEQRIGRLEGEVKAQSDLYLDVAGRMAGAATKADLGAAAANLVDAMTRLKPNEDIESLAEAVGSISVVAAAIAEQVATLAARPASAAVDLAGLDELRAQVSEIHKKLQAPMEMHLRDDENLSKTEKAIDNLGLHVLKLIENIDVAEEAYLDVLELRRKDLATLSDNMRELSEAATGVLDGAKYVAGAIMGTTYDNAQDGTVATKRFATTAMTEAMNTHAAARDAIKARATALGGGLIRVQSFTQTGKIDPVVIGDEQASK